ncbi:MAG: hydrogen peroxide-inducible genes activator [Alistipes sp.]|jgi:LysR family hydrogen peroxide-inducible transcriptional activator|nr:hydrogen peroxide-inducible genes activator [Alistipes sp.]
MTIIQLEYLLAVANCGSFSLAAQQSFVTQPTLSMQIKALEEELGVILLDRTKKPVIATEAGEVVIRNAREALRSYNYVRESVNELKGDTTGTLRLGVIPTVGPYLLHRFIPAFIKKYPKVDLDIYEMETLSMVDALERDALDAAIVSSGTTPDGIMEYELFGDTFHLYVSPSSDLYERSNVRIEDIDMKSLILLSQGHCLRDQVLELCQGRRAVHSRYNFESGSLETLMRIVDCTSCVTVIPQMATAFVPEERRGQIKTLAKGAMSRKVALAVRRTYVKHSIISALREAVIEIGRDNK